MTTNAAAGPGSAHSPRPGSCARLAYLVNAISTLLPYLERFLVDSVEAALPRVSARQAVLRESMVDFCYQERRHNANHVKFKRRERRRNDLRFGRMLVRLSTFVAPRLIGRAMRPRYDPAGMVPPPGMQELLDRMAAEYGVAGGPEPV